MDGTDVSKRTVLVLLVITVLVSVIGTWTVLNSVSETSTGWTASNPVPGSQISLEVEGRVPASEPADLPGNVALTVEQ